jgi:hypothetical protein
MKVLVGTISGIVFGVAGVAVASSTHVTASTATPQVAIVQPAVLPAAQVVVKRPVAQTTVTRLQGLTGQLSRNDTGAFELKVTVRQNGLLVDRDVRVIVARAKVTNRLGQSMALPLDDTTARVSGSLLPRSAWSVDSDGQLTPTFAAKLVVLLPTVTTQESDRSQQSADQSDQPDQSEG